MHTGRVPIIKSINQSGVPNRKKSASAVFSGSPRRVDCTIKISKFRNFFCLYSHFS